MMYVLNFNSDNHVLPVILDKHALSSQLRVDTLYGGAASTANDRVIPYKIYGIKGVITI